MSATQVAVEQQQWEDLYFRHNFQDTGLYPTAGALSQSPDIIPAGMSPYADPGQLITDANWAMDFGSSTNASTANYIYLRGQNLGTQGTKGKLYLYFSPAALLLFPTDPLDPTKGWSKNPLRTSQGAQYVTVNRCGERAFRDPGAVPVDPAADRGDHYCVIGRVVTDTHPNDIPTTGNLNDFARLHLRASEHGVAQHDHAEPRQPDLVDLGRVRPGRRRRRRLRLPALRERTQRVLGRVQLGHARARIRRCRSRRRM